MYYNSEKEWCCYKCTVEDVGPFDEEDCGPFVEVITHSFMDSTDELLRTPVSIVDFYQGSTYYFETSDFIINTNNIDWSPQGAEPTPGSSYTIVYYTCN